jgi:hypothetical protein
VSDRNVKFHIDVPSDYYLHKTQTEKEIGLEFRPKERNSYIVVIRMVRTDQSLDEFAQQLFVALRAKLEATTMGAIRNEPLDGHPAKRVMLTTEYASGDSQEFRIEVTMCGGVAFVASCASFHPEWAAECIAKLDSVRILNCN